MIVRRMIPIILKMEQLNGMNQLVHTHKRCSRYISSRVEMEDNNINECE
jgi:hypothetical protein